MSVKVTSTTYPMSLASVGLLSMCDCTQATFDPLYMQAEYVWVLDTTLVNIVVGGAAVVKTFTVYDSISLNCGDGLG
jgi:hypothetical protein